MCESVNLSNWGQSSTRAAGASQTLSIAGTEYRFRWIPAGTFMMGSPEDENGRCDKEILHKVTLTRGFWMQETETTQKQWTSVMNNNPSYFSKNGGAVDMEGIDTSEFPVENVSWNDAAGKDGFIARINVMNLGLRFRLPTEAEWEYAARAGEDCTFSGSNVLDDAGWYGGNSGYCTHKVGTKAANGWGLYDMSGNVDEWCSDWYGGDYYDRGAAKDPRGPKSGVARVLRGGCWGDDAWGCRSAYRGCHVPYGRSETLGFRLLLEAARQ